ncbi:type II toxin-antitoxin system RelE/ParE family toxin [Xanthobacter autotrophicus]|uniref:type II toxin-antitoxin system RelE/ParE family toxin n=1 Tax=Xanthobacter autotrophicus TaxID=280 RepID=UPI0024A75903|nr:type II toxin-antitoxin system RelE/ParE family toxin [Xanthobacter autotrophicus]MDI4657369.1 type II toxin-antitoxin system RelE/ParE family toxin [Xanthobacter autotrophicus]
MKLRYAAPAQRHLEEIFAYIASDNPAAARRVMADLRAAATLLKAAPHSGWPGSAAGTREWVVRRRPHVVVYRIEAEDEMLTIPGIFHTARLRP